MVIEKYVTKAEIIQWVNLQRSKAIEDDIPDIIMDEAHTKVDNEIVNKKCFNIDDGLPTEGDEQMFLKFAAFTFALSLLCKAGFIAQTTGEILTNRFGDVVYQYQRSQPMFFFATGASEPFMDLLPYETLRMYAFSFIKAYCIYRFWDKTGYKIPKLKLVRDKTSRGAFWNEPYTVEDEADSEYGDIIEEDFDYS